MRLDLLGALVISALGLSASLSRAQDQKPSSAEPAAPVEPPQASPAEPVVEASAVPQVQVKVTLPRPVSDAWKKFSELSLWEDGLSEMSYYDASCVLHDKRRKFTRVHLLNRQSMDTTFWVKATEHTKTRIPVFQLIISEEVPTDNYPYRFLTSVFLEHPSLEPFKVAASTQEYGGPTYKYLLWTRNWDNDQAILPGDWAIDIASHSYWGLEGDRWVPKTADHDPYEGLFLYARAVVASGGESRQMHVLKTLRSNHAADPEPIDGILHTHGDIHKMKVPLGEFDARRVVLEWGGEPTWFEVETAEPYRLLAFRAGDVEAELRFVERGAYWDQNWKSGFYKPGEAP